MYLTFLPHILSSFMTSLTGIKWRHWHCFHTVQVLISNKQDRKWSAKLYRVYFSCFTSIDRAHGASFLQFPFKLLKGACVLNKTYSDKKGHLFLQHGEEIKTKTQNQRYFVSKIDHQFNVQFRILLLLVTISGIWCQKYINGPQLV